MITEQQIKDYINALPPLPSTLAKCHGALSSGDIQKAAQYASQDAMLTKYLRDLTKKSIYGFTAPLTDVRVIFSTLGIARSRAAVQTYLMHLIYPEHPKVFKFSSKEYGRFTDELLALWSYLLDKKYKSESTKYVSLVSMVGALIVLVKSLFADHVDEIAMIRSVKVVDFETLIFRMSGRHIDELAAEIACQLALEPEVIEVLRYVVGAGDAPRDEVTHKIANYFTLTLFYTFTRPSNLGYELENLIPCNPEQAAGELDAFMEMVGEYESNN